MKSLRTRFRRSFIRLFVLLILIFMGGCAMFQMPGKSHKGPATPLDAAGEKLRDSLQRDVEMLAGEIGARNLFQHEELTRAADFLADALGDMGYRVERAGFEVSGKTYENIIAEKTGTSRPDEIVVIGGHYDSVGDCPGANDNASGAAAVLALARAFADKTTERTLRFVEFVNEEPPFFRTDGMGSLVYARQCRKRGDDIKAMLSLETMGYFSDKPGSQSYPFPFAMFYPSKGNFILFVGNMSSRSLLRESIGAFRTRAGIPSEGAAVPGWVPASGLSDHWSFWQEGFKAIMVTDTAPFRYRHYHRSSDTPDKVQYDNLARVVQGLEVVVEELANP